MSEAEVPQAPDLPQGLEWLNTAEPCRIGDQRGRVVVLHFFSVGCIHSQHQLEQLKLLANRFEDGITIIGVHGPRFPNEARAQRALKGLNRRHVRHPVVHDPGFSAWKQYGIRAWPSTVVVDCAGGVRHRHRGLVPTRELEQQIEDLLEEAIFNDQRDFSDMPTTSMREPRMNLAFPSGVCWYKGKFFVSDSGHNRILECNAAGNVLRQFGSGSRGNWDGDLDGAGFNAPGGLAVVRDQLFVADTGNHAVRRIDLISGAVTTVVGDARRGGVVREPVPSADCLLASPTGLACSPETVYVANAGSNQVLAVRLGTDMVEPYCGTGQEGCEDGPRARAALAQPRDVALCDEFLYIADAGNSCIRSVRRADGATRSSTRGGLLKSGNQDGIDGEGRLQHPCAVACDPKGRRIWIADTYNHLIRTLEPDRRELRTLDLKWRFHGPSALCIGENEILVADTDAHCIVRIAPDGSCSLFEPDA